MLLSRATGPGVSVVVVVFLSWATGLGVSVVAKGNRARGECCCHGQQQGSLISCSLSHGGAPAQRARAWYLSAVGPLHRGPEHGTFQQWGPCTEGQSMVPFSSGAPTQRARAWYLSAVGPLHRGPELGTFQQWGPCTEGQSMVPFSSGLPLNFSSRRDGKQARLLIDDHWRRQSNDSFKFPRFVCLFLFVCLVHVSWFLCACLCVCACLSVFPLAM